MCFTEGGQQILLPLFPGISAGLQPSTVSQLTPLLMLASQDAAALQDQNPAFLSTKGGAGAPLMPVHANYMMPLAQAQQPFGAPFLCLGPHESAASLLPIPADANLCNTQATQHPFAMSGVANPTFSETGKPAEARSGDVEDGVNRFEEMLSVRNFTSPIGSVMVRGRRMSMKVPPLARRRPPPCRSPPGVSSFLLL
ncbi:uncharacterized protein Tco025E_01307 [Trypanosoma conorhini]|uniref:Uncharacterized protein n=1 Tax=Trypanosoma conorhini TaxID=83891 RepID=A0A3R7M4R3_9TRYP|nr:uncharacterized protein Tco025E_01307 [Trypanosoma conorhini]RNF26534.1 hypothetical protein Tco025E_01307 [Trypanosoma conorhini]